MKFNIWTFLFQLINFFVLLWILKRLLYRPVREIMEKRRALIKKTTEDAERTRQDAEAMKGEYEKKVAELEEVRRKTIEKAQEEAEALRLEILRKADAEGRLFFEKEKARLEAERKRLDADIKEKAAGVGASYAAALLSELADQNLHNRILEMVVKVLPDISAETAPANEISIEIDSAYALTESFMEDVKRQFKTMSKNVTVNTTLAPELIAGAVLRVSDRIYDASIKGQLKAFEQKMRRMEK